MAKTRKASHPDIHLQKVTLEALALGVGPDLSTDANNCVVRTVKVYLSCTRSFLCGRKCLSIAYKPGHHNKLKAPTMSLWLVKMVCYIYEHMQDEAAHLFHVKGQDLHAIATIWNAVQKVSSRDNSCTLHSGDLTPSQCLTLLTSPSLKKTCTRSASWSLLIMSLFREVCSLWTVADSTLDHSSHHLYWVSRSGYCCSLVRSVLLFLLTD